MKDADVSELSARISEMQAFAGLIVRERNPENLEFPFSALNSFITSSEQFFVRSHFAVPKLDLDGWRLSIEGRVEKQCEISYEELLSMPSRTVTMTLECAGNSRIFLSPKVGGLQWELGAVSNAEWTGVPLAAVLKRAGIRAGAMEVVLEGADNGVITKEPVSPGKIHYARSLPLAKALMPEVSLTWFSVASNRARMVRNGFCKMVDTDYRNGHQFPRLFSDFGLYLLGTTRRVACAVASGKRSGGQGRNRSSRLA